MKNITTVLKKLLPLLFFTVFFVFLFVAIRGTYGNPHETDLNQSKWRDNGPFELSPERGRFALIYSIIENDSFFFSLPIARFVVPDLGYKNGHFVSLFAPAVSYIVAPGYLIGKYFGASQVGTFAIISLFALINAYLIKQISLRLGANQTASTIAGLVFLFGTPAYAYAVNLYQHHISAFLILFSLYLLLRWNNFWSLTIVWFLCAMSIPVDYPNLFLMFPIGIFALQSFYKIKRVKNKFKISFNILALVSILSVIIPLGFFMWFNQNSYGDPFQFSGTVGSVRAIDDMGLPTAATKVDPQDVDWYKNPDNQQKSASNFFKSRYLLNGINTHLFSLDRGIVIFTPVILLGLFGVFVLYKNKNRRLSVLLTIICVNILLYSMWGDPWGGWAFGSRYLVPSYSILAILLAVALTSYRNKWWFIIPFWLVLIYSIGVNTLGALTTSTNPPKGEAVALELISGKRERYSYDRNWEFLTTIGTKSFIYDAWGNKYFTAVHYYYFLAGSIAVVATGLTLALVLKKNEEDN